MFLKIKLTLNDSTEIIFSDLDFVFIRSEIKKLINYWEKHKYAKVTVNLANNIIDCIRDKKFIHFALEYDGKNILLLVKEDLSGFRPCYYNLKLLIEDPGFICLTPFHPL